MTTFLTPLQRGLQKRWGRNRIVNTWFGMLLALVVFAPYGDIADSTGAEFVAARIEGVSIKRVAKDRFCIPVSASTLGYDDDRIRPKFLFGSGSLVLCTINDAVAISNVSVVPLWQGVTNEREYVFGHPLTHYRGYRTFCDVSSGPRVTKYCAIDGDNCQFIKSDFDFIKSAWQEGEATVVATIDPRAPWYSRNRWGLLLDEARGTAALRLVEDGAISDVKDKWLVDLATKVLKDKADDKMGVIAQDRNVILTQSSLGSNRERRYSVHVRGVASVAAISIPNFNVIVDVARWDQERLVLVVQGEKGDPSGYFLNIATGKLSPIQAVDGDLVQEIVKKAVPESLFIDRDHQCIMAFDLSDAFDVLDVQNGTQFAARVRVLRWNLESGDTKEGGLDVGRLFRVRGNTVEAVLN